MKQLKLIALTLIIAGISTSQASIVAFDYTTEPVSQNSLTEVKNVPDVISYLYLSTTGASTTLAERIFTISASGLHPNYLATVNFDSGFTIAALNDVVDTSTAFAAGNLVTSSKNNISTDTGYLAFEFDAGNSQSYFGWVEVSWEVESSTGSTTSSSTLNILRMAYNDVEDDSIVVGAIPEPAVASLIILFGSSLLVGRRLFIK